MQIQFSADIKTVKHRQSDGGKVLELNFSDPNGDQEAINQLFNQIGDHKVFGVVMQEINQER